MTYLFDMNASLRNPQENFDRRFGYAILFLLLLILAASAFFGIGLVKKRLDLRIIAFEQVGNLKIDDPVKLRGIDVGTIKKIESHEQKVLVFIETQTPLKIHRGYHIDDKDVGLMGDRIIMIMDGDSASPLIPKTDTLTGTFLTGVSEAVGLAWKLRDIIDSFTVISSQILHGVPKRKSLIKQVHDMVDVTDSASGSIVNIAARINKDFDAKVDSMERFVTHITRLSKSVDSSAPRYLSAFEGKIKILAVAVNKLDDLSDTLLKYSGRIEKTGGLEILGNEAQIKAKLNALHDAIGHVKEGLLKFQVYFK